MKAAKLPHRLEARPQPLVTKDTYVSNKLAVVGGGVHSLAALVPECDSAGVTGVVTLVSSCSVHV